MEYKLAKKLKDAGFPFNYINDPRQIADVEFEDGSFVLFPTLSELIEACGEDFQMLTVRSPSVNRFYQAYTQNNETGEGKTPEEAVADLWLRINSNG